ncbi:MAG: hypothetical protein LBH44_10000 [Treponema sp.]|jgi:hypothetical protein|nr:hypothetical protein [Treponema sp.]
MKHIVRFALLITAAFFAVVFFSCNEVLALGEKLILDGPVVNIDRPFARQPVDGIFYIKGTVTSKNDFNRMLIKAKFQEKLAGGNFKEAEFKMQWRCQGGKWEVSLDSGRSWTPVQPVTINEQGNDVVHKAEWKVNKNKAEWKVPINMTLLPGFTLADGQYQFSVTAWDIAQNSDANSYKTRTVIVDTEPPMVTIVDPHLYAPFSELNETTSELYKLDALAEIDANRRDPQYLGKFLNSELNLQYQIEAVNDVWSIDIVFYDKDELDWDDNAAGEDNYIYRAFINDAKNRPAAPNPKDTLKPNGRIKVPNLAKCAPGVWKDEDGVDHELKSNITDKTTLHVIVRCMSASGLELQEKSMGGFIYWPESDKPWISFPEALKAAHTANPYMVFPSTVVPSRAYDDDGIDKVVYTFYPVNISDGLRNGPAERTVTEINPTRTRVFSWQFNPPMATGDYEIEAVVYDIKGVTDTFKGFFRVMDISFPEIREPYTPVSSRPLFEFITGGTIPNWRLTIEGYATAESRIKNVHMVWINPHSTNYAAMSQLAYFRDPEYEGWKEAPPSPGNAPGDDVKYDSNNPNKVWNMALTDMGIENTTGRRLYRYSATVNLRDHLNIAPGIVKSTTPVTVLYDYLKSQVFVLKATDINETPPNVNGKSTMITWAPQGDTEAPKIEIGSVQIQRSGGGTFNLTPGIFISPIEQFGDNDRITVTGTWREDSTGSAASNAATMNIENILRQFLLIKINDRLIDNTKNTTMTINPATGKAANGTWTASGTVRKLGTNTEGVVNPDPGTHTLIAESLKDTLVVSAELTDIGGSKSEFAASWLIQSDNLKFLRVGSMTADGIYPMDEDINIFLEFNKPVVLKPGRSVAHPQLTLNTVGGAQGIATYNSYNDHAYPNKEGEASTRQHFTYRVTDLQQTPLNQVLTVTALTSGDAAFSTAGYPYTWTTPAAMGEEEIRMVTSNRTATGSYELQRLPVSVSSAASDYLFTLGAGKSIKIDTVPPKLLSVQPNIKAGYYAHDNTIYVTLNFDEPVRLGTGAQYPRLVMNIQNSTRAIPDPLGIQTSRTETRTTTAQVNNNSIIFSYPIQNLDTTNFTDLRITGIVGSVYDLASSPGNRYDSTAFSAVNLTGIRVHAVKPPAPTLEVLTRNPPTTGAYTLVATNGTSAGASSSWKPTDYADSNAFNTSSVDKINLRNLYIDNLHVRVTPDTTLGPDSYARIEYSSNYGKDWALYETPYATPKQRTALGNYELTARQIDAAGNESGWSKPVTLYWDKGDLLTRITSVSPNGVYTNTKAVGGGREDKISVTLYFRIPVIFKSDPTFVLNTVDNNNVKATVTPAWSVLAAGREFTFEYAVGQYDNSPVVNDVRQRLQVLEMNNMDVSDQYGVTVSDLVNMNMVTANNTNLHHLKNITVQTGALQRTGNPRLFSDTSRTGNNDQTSPNFQGQKTDDDSYWQTLEIIFERDVFRGELTLPGTIPNVVTVTQVPSGYRLPAVLTETQRARYRSVPGFETFYFRGTNGYLVERNAAGAYVRDVGPDTTAKYILSDDYDAYNITPNSAAAAGSIAKFAYDFMLAEQVVLPINSSMVEISGNKVLVRLTGSNALKVPGADYEIKFPAGMVQDELGNPCAAYTGTHSVSGVARPFIRVQRPQESYELAASPGTSQPRFVVKDWSTVWAYAYVRMDCRTPGSVVRYIGTPSTQSQSDYEAKWSKQWDVPVYNLSTNAARDKDPTRPAAPTATTGEVFGTPAANPTVFTPISIGAAASGNMYQGYRWRVHAVGVKGTAVSAIPAEDIVYRSVLTFVGNNILATGGQNLQSGDQMWVRGGNTMTSTTIPGFPLTNDDNFAELNTSGSRAGIRLMQKTGAGNLNNSTWQWVTWDMNSTAYYTFIMGRDNVSTAEQAWQYGPLQFAAQFGNWSPLKEYYCLFPGGHRYLGSNNPQFEGSGGSRVPPFTFNGSFDLRGNFSYTGKMP